MHATTKGPFSSEEKAAADRIFEEVCQREAITKNDLKAQIQDWRNLRVFKDEVCEILPNRSGRNIRDFCRRRYHNSERGSWTQDQDNDLRRAHAQLPDKWTKISELVGRTANDCRDRWRSTLKCKDGKNIGPWSQQEEEKLRRLVEQCEEAIERKKPKGSAESPDKKNIVSVINWNLVSDGLENHRSAKQCREKFEKLQLRDARERDDVPKNPERRSNSPSRKRPTKRDRCLAKVKDFELGDYYDILVEIHTSFPDHTQRFHDEDNVVWAIVSQKNPGSRFADDSARGTLRRVAFETAMKWDLHALRRELRKAPSIAAQALILAKSIEDTKNPSLKRKYQLETPTSAKRRRESSPKASERKSLSKETVTDSSTEVSTDSSEDSSDDEEEVS